MIEVWASFEDKKVLEAFFEHLRLGDYAALEIPQNDGKLKKYIIQKVNLH